MSFHVGISWKLQLGDGWMPSFSVKVEGKNTTPLESGREFFPPLVLWETSLLGRKRPSFSSLVLPFPWKTNQYDFMFSFLFSSTRYRPLLVAMSAAQGLFVLLKFREFIPQEFSNALPGGISITPQPWAFSNFKPWKIWRLLPKKKNWIFASHKDKLNL